MPLWHIYHPENAYSRDDKLAFGTAITDLYAKFGLPRFYVSVIFHALPAESFLIGGEPTNDFIRIWLDQIARRVPETLRWAWVQTVNETIEPFVHARGFRWEVHMDETPDDLWTINGLKPPPGNSDVEKQWATQGHASDYEREG